MNDDENMDVETRALVHQVAEDLQRKRLTGLGGWLTLFIVICILSLLVLAYQYLQPADPYGDMELGLTRLNPIWHLGDIARVLLVVAALALMFKRSRNAPSVCRVMLVFGFVQNTLYMFTDPEGLLAALEREMDMNTTSPCMIVTAAHLAYMLGWVSYFNKSKRVKYTFGLDFPEGRIGKVFQ